MNINHSSIDEFIRKFIAEFLTVATSDDIKIIEQAKEYENSSFRQSASFADGHNDHVRSIFKTLDYDLHWNLKFLKERDAIFVSAVPKGQRTERLTFFFTVTGDKVIPWMVS